MLWFILLSVLPLFAFIFGFVSSDSQVLGIALSEAFAYMNAWYAFVLFVFAVVAVILMFSMKFGNWIDGMLWFKVPFSFGMFGLVFLGVVSLFQIVPYFLTDWLAGKIPQTATNILELNMEIIVGIVAMAIMISYSILSSWNMSKKKKDQVQEISSEEKTD